MLEPQNLYIKLPGDVADALYRTAHRRWRRPKDQAVFLIAEGLRQLGALPIDPTLTTEPEPLEPARSAR